RPYQQGSWWRAGLTGTSRAPAREHRQARGGEVRNQPPSSGFNLRENIPVRSMSLLPHHHAAHIINDDFAFLLNAARTHLDNSPLRLAFGFALIQHFGLR